MKIKHGELYFIGERDVLTGESTGYVKIGLIKDSRQGGTAKRLDEHQTGNPRRLENLWTIPTPAITELEATMHQRFAADRILGEWFQLASPRLEAVAEVAGALAEEQTKHLVAAEQAVELRKLRSSGEVRAANDEDLMLQRELQVAQALAERVSDLVKRSSDVFKMAIAAGLEVGRFARQAERPRQSFDKEKFSETHPDLFARYQKTEVVFEPKFLPRVPKGLPAGIEHPDEFLDLERRMVEASERAAGDPGSLEELHLLYLEILRFGAEAHWAESLASTRLKVACGECAGIDGVATWNRLDREVTRFDSDRLQVDHPDLHAEFVMTRMESVFEFERWRSYPLLKSR
jgi:hypothetical protein